MDKIWANRLIAGTKTWAEMPARRHAGVKAELTKQVTEGEIVDAIHRVPGARSLDGVKRRTRAGMGRCQAGFCSPRVLEILSRELGVPQEQLTKSGGASFPIVGKTRKDGENA